MLGQYYHTRPFLWGLYVICILQMSTRNRPLSNRKLKEEMQTVLDEEEEDELEDLFHNSRSSDSASEEGNSETENSEAENLGEYFLLSPRMKKYLMLF